MALEHVVLRVRREQAQPVEGALAVDVDVLAQRVERVARREHAVPGVDIVRERVAVGRQRLDQQLQPALRRRADIDQIHAAVKKRGAGLQIRLHDLQLRAALLQIADIAEIAVEIADFRIENFDFHACTSSCLLCASASSARRL